VASVAAGVQTTPDAIEVVCERLARQGQFLEDRGLAAWPDGTVSGRYGFRHALYQEVVYQRLSAGRRARCHRLIGSREEAGYGEGVSERAAELAVHFERGRDYQRAVPYLQQAAENAARRHAYHEVTALLTRCLELLATLPETLARTQQELALQIALGAALTATKGPAAPEVEQTYARARALCQQVGETPQLFPALRGLCEFYRNRGALQTAQELGEQLDRLTQRAAAPMLRLEAHEALGATLLFLGDYAAALTHFEQGIGLTDPTAQRAQALRHGVAPGVRCLTLAANTLWCLGAPAQAVWRSQQALALAQELAHPYSRAVAQYWAAYLHHNRHEVPAVQEQAEALLTLATAQGFPLWVGLGTCWRGWVLAMQGRGEAGVAQLHQGLAAVLATGQTLMQPFHLVLLAEALGHTGQVEAGLRLLAEALAEIEASGQGYLLAEAYRLQGVLLLQRAVPDPAQAEACFHQALTVARRQQAKSWELRAAMSLSRLWQCHGKRAEAYTLLAPIYDWFTEGFDTVDLQEARALLEALG
jgi:predicted ATPase